MKRGGPLERRTPLRADPSKIAEWHRRSLRPMPRRGPSAMWFAARDIVMERAAGCCEVEADGCTVAAVHVHHRRRRSQGGSDLPINLLAVCKPCHDRIHSHPAWAFGHGFLLREEAA